MQHYWDRHPFQYELLHILHDGQWVTHVFEWIFMMISRFAGYLMTLAVGYLIYYAIEFKHSLDAVSVHPTFPDQLAILSNVIINVGPELVFPGVVVLCIRSFTTRRWLDGMLYLVTTIAFMILTMVLLNAFMNDGITKDFLSAMLFWRAGAALFYTIVVAYCGSHGGLDFRSLLNELDTLRGEVDGGQQTVDTLQEHLSSVQQQASTLQQQVSSGQQEIANLRGLLDTEQQRTRHLQEELKTGNSSTTTLQRQLNAAQIEVETLQTQLEGKKQELVSLRKTMENGQEWQESRVQQMLETEQQRVASLQQQLNVEQSEATAMRRQLNTALVDVDGLRAQVEAKHQEVEVVRGVLDGEQQSVATLRTQLEVEQRRVSSLRQRLERGEVSKVSSGQGNVDIGHDKTVDGGQGKVVQLDASRRKGGQDAAENAIGEQIKYLLTTEPSLSDRAIAGRVGCSPTTVGKWRKSMIEQVQNEQPVVVGE